MDELLGERLHLQSGEEWFITEDEEVVITTLEGVQIALCRDDLQKMVAPMAQLSGGVMGGVRAPL